MILFFDRSVGVRIPRAFQSLKPPVGIEYHQNHFAMDEADDAWLLAVGSCGWFAVGHDYSYHLKPHELQAIRQYNIGVFYIWGSEAPAWDTVQAFFRAYDRIAYIAANEPRPFVFRSNRQGRVAQVAI